MAAASKDGACQWEHRNHCRYHYPPTQTYNSFLFLFLLCGKLDMGVFEHANVHFLPQTYPIFQKSKEKIERISFFLLFFSITPTSQSTTDTHRDWLVPQNYSCFWKLIKKQNNKALGLGCDMLAITGKCCLLNSAKFKVSKLEKMKKKAKVWPPST